MDGYGGARGTAAAAPRPRQALAASGIDDDGPCAVFDASAGARRLRARNRWPRFLFRAPGLNRCQFVKVLRAGLDGGLGAGTATELRVPVDASAPDGPALAVPLDRSGVEAALATFAGFDRRRDVAGYACDMLAIERLKAMPSFDPWLLRVRLGRVGAGPDPAYLDQPADGLRAAEAAVEGHMAAAVAFSIAVEVGDRAMSQDLDAARRTWRRTGAPALMPLGRRLGLSDAALPTALEAWEATAYYAWRRGQAHETWTAMRAWLVAGARRSAQPPAWGVEDPAEAAVRALSAVDAVVARIDAELRRYAGAHSAMFADYRDAQPMASWLGDAEGVERRLGAGFVAVGRAVGFWRRTRQIAATPADRAAVADRIARMLPSA